MLTQELQIAQRARKYSNEALTNLHQFIDVGLLEDSYQSLNKKSSPGVDKETWHDYGERSKSRLPELLKEFKGGQFKAPAIKRVYIPKGVNGKRPLGIPSLEDKILQGSCCKVLNPIYEEEFKGFSYGFRKGHSPHQALEYMFKEVSFKGRHYIIDADIKGYFDNINHGILREFLDRRVKDGVIRKMIDKWLKAGILEGKELRYPTKGTPQGGLISPLLSNIYLHYVLDVWFTEEVKPLLKGKSFIVRYADDFVLGFDNLKDAQRVMKVLPKRFGKYDLELHPEKTKIVNLHSKRGQGSRSYGFLGFTHYLEKSRKGKWVLKRKTSKKKLSAACQKVENWLKQNRQSKLVKLIPALNVRLRGHYNYYGITFNYRGISKFYRHVTHILHKWLNRRGGKRIWNWDRVLKLISVWQPLLKPKLYHSFISAKPI